MGKMPIALADPVRSENLTCLSGNMVDISLKPHIRVIKAEMAHLKYLKPELLGGGVRCSVARGPLAQGHS